MSRQGWICIHRTLMDHWLWEKSDYLKAWIAILMDVNHAPKKILRDGQTVTIERGQSCNSLETWAKKFGKRWTVKKVRTFISLLEKDSMLVSKRAGRLRLLTVVNYSTYQDKDNGKGHDNGHDKGASRARLGHNEGTIGAPNNNDKQLITTKNNDQQDAIPAEDDLTFEMPSSSSPCREDFNFWRNTKSKVFMARTGDDGDLNAWRQLWLSQAKWLIDEQIPDLTVTDLFNDYYKAALGAKGDQPRARVFFSDIIEQIEG